MDTRIRGRAPAALLSLVVGVVAVVGTFGAAQNQPERRALDAVAIVLLVAGPVALAWVGRHAVPVLVIEVAVTLTYLLAGYPYGPVVVAVAISLFVAVQAGHRLEAWLGAAAIYFGHFTPLYVMGSDELSLGPLLGVAAWLIVLLVVAEVVRARRDGAAAARRSQEEESLRRASDERVRIARELHDVVAHHMSLINVQAGVALHLVDERPEQARTALSAIKSTSKEALVEMRSIVGVLRGVDESAPRQPVPGLARLDDLVEGTRTSGLVVRTRVEGDPHALPRAVDQAAYRIVQESLTNVVRHSGAGVATVLVGYGDELLHVQVDDDGRGPGQPGELTAGSGLTGMRERATALGGTFDAGPGAGKGFRVSVRLPVAEPS